VIGAGNRIISTGMYSDVRNRLVLLLYMTVFLVSIIFNLIFFENFFKNPFRFQKHQFTMPNHAY